MGAPPPRRRRTWSRFPALGRVPTEYEVLTHDLNYTLRPGRAAALESNPTTPANMWYRSYRDGSPLTVEDWNGFRDPDELTYRRYVTLQDEQETVTAGIMEEFARVDHDAGLSPPWLDVLAGLLTTQRYPTHALQMAEAYVGSVAPSSYITNCAAFAAGDLLRRVALLAYRTRQLQLTHPDRGFGARDRGHWETNRGWQPARRALERVLTVYDWGECFTAINLVLRPTLDEVLLYRLGAAAQAAGDNLTWLLLENLRRDSERSGRWSAALARYAIDQRPANAAVLARWVERWGPRADEAADRLQAALDDAAPASEHDARRRLLTEAGLDAS